ncbi:MAG TPA: zf-HC2 domain-containing protein [Myxococcales bacterium]|nr:zf-HC2 domain-containing protein [Myxococcales bacterium]
MSFWNRHAEADLEALVAGTASPARRRRILRHVRSCERCGPRYEQLVVAHRALAGRAVDEPGPAELSALREANRAAVLRGEKAEPARRMAWVPALAAGAAAVVAVAIFWRPAQGTDEFRPRGAVGEQDAVVRVFCARKDAPLEELRPEGRCPVGASLAFAVGAIPTMERVEVKVAGRPGEYAGAVSGTPGREAPVPWTVELSTPGRVEITATFTGAGGAVVRRQIVVHVEPAP